MNPPPPDVIRLVRAALGPDADGPADAALLARFARDRDEGAFELLVWRHAGMVLRVCRGVLRDHHAAEDACQAVFLALARQAGAVGRRGAVAGWLYRVARRVANRAARRRDRHTAAELDRLPAAEVSCDPALVRVLHDEVDRLPEKYRVPVLLCFFEGLTHADAARRLGWPVGTLATRIARAKERLHHRLTRRGVAAPAGGVAAVLAAEPAAAVPPAFAGDTARAAVEFAAGGVVFGVSADVLELAKGAIRTMTVTKLQWAAGVVVACGALAAGGVWATTQGPGGQGPAARPAAGESPAASVASAARTANAEQRRRSLNNLSKILIGIHSYHDTYTFLPADIRDKDGKPLLSWRVAILPHLGLDDLYKQFKLAEPWDSEHNFKLLTKLPPVYRVGFEPDGSTHTHYQVFAGPGTPFGPSRFAAAGGDSGLGGAGGAGIGATGGAGSLVPPGGAPPIGGGSPPLPGGIEPARGGGAPPLPGGLPGEGGRAGPADAPPTAPGPIRITNIADGTSNTLGVVEAGPAVPWTKPADLPFDPAKPPKLAGPFANAVHVAWMDGSATALKRDIDSKSLRTMIVMDDGEVLPDLKRLRAPLPADTPEEKAALADLVAKNRELIEEIDRLNRENLGLLGGRNRRVTDFGQAEDLAEQLQQIIKDLKEENKKLRDEQAKGVGKPK